MLHYRLNSRSPVGAVTFSYKLFDGCILFLGYALPNTLAWPSNAFYSNAYSSNSFSSSASYPTYTDNSEKKKHYTNSHVLTVCINIVNTNDNFRDK